MRTMLMPWLAALSLLTSGAGQSVIPPISGTTLGGEKVELPRDIGAQPVVLILGFSQASRDQATAWGKRLAADANGGGNIRYYETPVLAAVPRLLRGLVLKKIAQDLSGPAKNHFLPVYDHEAEWRAAAGYRNADDAYVLLIDGDGAVRWSCAGSVSDTRDAELNQRIAALRRP